MMRIEARHARARARRILYEIDVFDVRLTVKFRHGLTYNVYSVATVPGNKCCSTKAKPALGRQMCLEEPRDFAEGFLGLWRKREQKLRMTLPFKYLKYGLHAGLAELSVGPDCVAERSRVPDEGSPVGNR
jgi:hypothetical protein